MYYQILEGLREFMGFESVESPDFAEYLQSLQESVIQLRQAYRTNSVQIDYTASNIQAAYMLAYFPQYVDMAYEIFKSLETFQDSNTTENLKEVIERKLFENNEGLAACFFAAGPAPESVALCKYLAEDIIKYDLIIFKPNIIHLKTFDIDWHSWSLSRHLTRNHILSDYDLLITGLKPHQINLLSKGAFSRYEQHIRKADIIFFQNCLNELFVEKEDFLKNLNDLLSFLEDEAILIIANLGNYPLVNDIFQRIEALIKQNSSLKLLRSAIRMINIKLLYNTRLPKIITNNLLTREDHLIPRENVNFNYIIVYKPCLSKKVNKANSYYELARQKCEQNMFKDAIQDFTQAISIKPYFAQAYYLRGFANFQLEQYQEADEDFTKALEINPNSYTYWCRGEVKHQLGQYQEAIEDLTNCININSKFEEAYCLRAKAKYQLGQYQEAIEDFKNALNLNRGLIEAREGLQLAESKLYEE